jgi:hypothetical protein
MASDANSPWAHLMQDTAGMANQTPSTPFPSDIQVTLPNSRFICPQDHCKMEKTAPPVQTTSLFTSVIQHPRFGSNNSASTIHRQHQTIPHHQAIAFASIVAEIAQELTKIHPIKLEPSSTPPTIHLGHTSPLRKRVRRLHHPPTISMIPHHQAIASTSILAEIARELTKIHPIKLEPSPTPHNFTSVIHRQFGSNYGASTIHRQRQMIPHHQTIANTPIIKKIA